MPERKRKEAHPSIRELYPNLTDGEVQEAEEILERYIALVLRIYERILEDPESRRRFLVLTEKDPPATIQDRSNFS